MNYIINDYSIYIYENKKRNFYRLNSIQPINSKNHVIDKFSNSIFLKTNFLLIFIITFFIYFHT